MLLDDRLTLRISSEAKSKFINLCEEHKLDHNDILRVMIDAFNGNRMRIMVPELKSKQLEIFTYVHRK